MGRARPAPTAARTAIGFSCVTALRKCLLLGPNPAPGDVRGGANIPRLDAAPHLSFLRASTLIRQLNAPVRAAIGGPGKARRRRGLLPARRSNAAWRVERGAHGCVALSPRR